MKQLNRPCFMLFAVIMLMPLFFVWNAPLFAVDVTLAWNPNSESDLAGYKLYYGTASHSYGSPVIVGNKTTYTVSGLGAKTYYFAVVAYNTSGKESGFSDEVSKDTSASADTSPPSISNALISKLSDSGMTISWTTNEISDTQVEFGTATTYGSSTPLVSTLVTNHSVQLTGLQPITLYHFRVKSRDAAGNLAKSADFTAQTLLPPVTNVSVK
jgi:purple acid phosphatase-like protein/fibronectin type III domain protein